MAMTPNELVNYFQDYRCPICKPGTRVGAFTTWFRVKPESAQSLHNQGAGVKANYEQKIRKEIEERGYRPKSTHSGFEYPLNVSNPVGIYGQKNDERDACVGLFFGLSESCTDKDADNMAKLFLDAIKGKDGFLSDDKVISHLEVIKRNLIADPQQPHNYLVGVRIGLVGPSVTRDIAYSLFPNLPVL
jgi:Holliday junction resolvase RusA-like endonuclease